MVLNLIFVLNWPRVMKRPHYILLLLSLFCCNHAEKESPAEKILRHSAGGDFRGVNIGDNREDVIKFENGATVYNMPDELVYRIGDDNKDSTWYEISYNFNQQGLYDISMDIFPKTENGLSEIRNEFIEYYINKYGDCKYKDGYCQWRTMTENGHIVSITLTDTITESPRPCLRVNFNESQ